DTSGIPMYLSFVDYEFIEQLPLEYRLLQFGKQKKWKQVKGEQVNISGVVDAVWQNFDSAVLDCEASKSENLGSASL
ncbi:MAG: hypothetical protein ACXWPG_21875, partial [Ktedonobacteraceae bacterium]